MSPDLDTTDFVKKLKLSLIKNKYPSVPHYNVSGEDLQILPNVIDGIECDEPPKKKFKSKTMQIKYEKLKKKMNDLLEWQRQFNNFEERSPKREKVERRNSF